LVVRSTAKMFQGLKSAEKSAIPTAETMFSSLVGASGGVVRE
jgi:hypothetical protein